VRRASSPVDAATIDGLWRQVRVTGGLPAAAAPVQSRLIRQVGRAELPSGPVFLKVMAFPRGKDRLRYLLRALPAVHEARMLRRVAAAGIPCPEVVAVRTARRFGLPHRSLLVVRALPVASASSNAPVELLRRCAELAGRLLAAGLWHPDLHPDNFVPLEDGRLAVLDLQSMRSVGPGRRSKVRAARRMAARLLLEAALMPVTTALAELVRSGLIAAGDGVAVESLACDETLALLRTRVGRCLQTSTEYLRRWSWRGSEHRRRGPLPAGKWMHGGTELYRCWVGQRLRELFDRQPPVLPAFRRNWRWLPGRNSLYIPATMAGDHRVLQFAEAGFERHAWLWDRRQDRDLEALRELRARHARPLDPANRVRGS